MAKRIPANPKALLEKLSKICLALPETTLIKALDGKGATRK
jgi:hypothetical protein